MTTLKKLTTVRPVYELTENGTSNILVPLLVVVFSEIPWSLKYILIYYQRNIHYHNVINRLYCIKS